MLRFRLNFFKKNLVKLILVTWWFIHRESFLVALYNSSSSYWLWNDPLLTATNLSFSMKTVSAESDLVWNFWFCQNVFFGRQSFKSVITARSVSIVFRLTTKDFTTFLSTIVDWESSSWQSCLNFIAGVCFFFFLLSNKPTCDYQDDSVHRSTKRISL